jgi:hypothetical protein
VDGKATVKPPGTAGGTATVKQIPPDVYTKDEFLIPAGPYYNVRAGRGMVIEDEIVMGVKATPKRLECGFDVAGDKRLKQATMRHRLDVNQNMTASFNPANMVCYGCKARGPHSVIGGEGQDPVVLVVSDQNFPPVLFSENNGACIAILRIEFGSIKEIGFAIGDMLSGIRLPEGSVILVGSVSDLDKQGVTGYAEELARTIRIVKEKQGGKAQVSSLPAVLLAGINSFRLLRNILEMEFWLEKLEGGDAKLLTKTRNIVVELIGKRGIGQRRSPEEIIYTLPKGVGVYDKVRLRSVGWVNMPERMEPITEEDEALIINTMVAEIRTNYGVRVSSQLESGRDKMDKNVLTEVVCIGGSNAERLGDVLEKMGVNVVKITKKGWKPTKKGVEEMVELMGDRVSKEAVVIFQGLDNSTFYEENEDGDRAFPKADSDGRYHVVGRVEVASPRQVKSLVRNCGPILERIRLNKKLLLSPTVRYFRETCCECREHCTNVGHAGYRRNMIVELDEIKDAIVEQCREEGMTLYKVASPLDLVGIRAAMEEVELEKLLGKDPVHMTGEGYAALAVNALRLIESRRTLFVGEKRERSESMETELEEVGGWARHNHEWLFETVSGAGGWKPGKEGKTKAKSSKYSKDNTGAAGKGYYPN